MNGGFTMGLQCKPIGKLKGVHKRLENQLLKERNELKATKEGKKKK